MRSKFELPTITYYHDTQASSCINMSTPSRVEKQVVHQTERFTSYLRLYTPQAPSQAVHSTKESAPQESRM